MTVPFNFRNVICPWQSPRDIELQSRFAARMWKKLSQEDRTLLFRLNEDREWK